MALAVTACTAQPGSLQEAERLLAEAPDSSLAVLEGVSPASLRSRAQRAAYTLLYVRAQEACFGSYLYLFQIFLKMIHIELYFY